MPITDLCSRDRPLCYMDTCPPGLTEGHSPFLCLLLQIQGSPVDAFVNIKSSQQEQKIVSPSHFPDCRSSFSEGKKVLMDLGQNKSLCVLKVGSQWSSMSETQRHNHHISDIWFNFLRAFHFLKRNVLNLEYASMFPIHGSFERV